MPDVMPIRGSNGEGNNFMPKPDKVTKGLGLPHTTFKGLRVHAKLFEPKTERGSQYIWMVIKQDRDGKKWRMSETLAYADSVQIKFVPKVEKSPKLKRR
jgi:hypothetical protein